MSEVKIATIDRETLLVHPKDLSVLKKTIYRQLNGQKNKWNDKLGGVVTSVTNIKILNGARGKVMDCEPHLHY